MDHFLIYTNQHKDEGLATSNRIKAYLESCGRKVTLRVKDAEWRTVTVGGFPGDTIPDAGHSDDDLPDDVDCIIVLGGDGTVLQAARETRMYRIPIIGVNLGTMGYMTEVEPSNLEEALDRLIRKDYTKEVRMMLKGTVTFAEERAPEEDRCLNDIIISRKGSIQIICLDIYVNGQFLHHYKADGMIVTTPTGSTGYSLSAGGPLIEPSAKLIMLTPICPHSLNQRSIVLAPEDVIEIEIAPGQNGLRQTVEVNFDGGHGILMGTGDRIRISQSEKTTEFIRLNQVSFLEVLHKKFSD